jgi:oxygen-dependent protoporphyrinogen oxidase
MFERLVQPLVGGIYTADPDRLSVAATMPRFLEMEQTHGSLIRAMMKQRRMKKQAPENGGGARYSMFMTLRGGMSQLIDALGESLPAGSIKLNSPVSRLTTCCAGGRKRWSIQTSTDSDRNSNCRRDSDAVILAAPASHAANILDSVDDVLSHELAGISYASCAVASLAFRRDQIGHLLGSFGFVVPHIEDRHILSCSFSSLKYEGRAPEETVLMRVFIGGACQPELLRLPDEQLLELAAGELSKLLDVKGQPILRHLTRQTDAMPQYHVGHQDRVEKISQRLEKFPTLAIASNAIGGVGVPNCIESGKAAAERVAQSLTVDSLQKLEVASLHP